MRTGLLYILIAMTTVVGCGGDDNHDNLNPVAPTTLPPAATSLASAADRGQTSLQSGATRDDWLATNGVGDVGDLGLMTPIDDGRSAEGVGEVRGCSISFGIDGVSPFVEVSQSGGSVTVAYNPKVRPTVKDLPTETGTDHGGEYTIDTECTINDRGHDIEWVQADVHGAATVRKSYDVGASTTHTYTVGDAESSGRDITVLTSEIPSFYHIDQTKKFLLSAEASHT